MPTRTAREDLPGTIERSPKKVRDTYAKTLDNDHRQYPGDEERAHRTAIAAVKHSFEKVGDRWVPKKRRGPSDPRAARGGPPSRGGRSYGGVDVLGHTKDELYQRARKLGVAGRSRMTKAQLADAIARAQR